MSPLTGGVGMGDVGIDGIGGVVGISVVGVGGIGGVSGIGGVGVVDGIGGSLVLMDSCEDPDRLSLESYTLGKASCTHFFCTSFVFEFEFFMTTFT